MALFPPDSIVIPYETEPDCSPYETGIARYAHALLTSYESRHVQSAEYENGKTLLILDRPFIMWDIDRNVATLFRALILVEQNEDGRQDAYTSDDPALLVRAFRAFP